MATFQALVTNCKIVNSIPVTPSSMSESTTTGLNWGTINFSSSATTKNQLARTVVPANIRSLNSNETITSSYTFFQVQQIFLAALTAPSVGQVWPYPNISLK